MTAKEIANDIMRRKYALKGNGAICVICDKKTINALDDAGFVARWKDVHHGSVIFHKKICGASYVSSAIVPLSKEAETIGYEVITDGECNKRYKAHLSKHDI